MHIVYCHSEAETIPMGEHDEGSIFLAGPTQRGLAEGEITPWRREALRLLKAYGFRGQVFVPEPYRSDLDEAQKKWEFRHLSKARVIAFWIPRTEELPGNTTNIEFGFFLGHDRKKVLYGRPPGALRTSYNDFLFREVNGSAIFDDLPNLLSAAVLLASYWA